MRMTKEKRIKYDEEYRKNNNLKVKEREEIEYNKKIDKKMKKLERQNKNKHFSKIKHTETKESIVLIVEKRRYNEKKSR